jgi:hypothetical protein
LCNEHTPKSKTQVYRECSGVDLQAGGACIRKNERTQLKTAPSDCTLLATSASCPCCPYFRYADSQDEALAFVVPSAASCDTSPHPAGPAVPTLAAPEEQDEQEGATSLGLPERYSARLDEPVGAPVLDVAARSRPDAQAQAVLLAVAEAAAHFPGAIG